MKDEEDRKKARRQSVARKNMKKGRGDLEQRSTKHQKYDFIKQKKDIEEEELWDEWKDYYR